MTTRQGSPDYGFLRTPRWIVGIAIALIAAVTFVNLGLWQLRRLDERRDRNDLISSRIDEAPAALRDVLAGPDTDVEAAAGEWRNVAVTGRYAYDDEVYLRSQSHQGTSGMRVLTPLLLDDGSGAIIVDRGWVPLDTPGPPLEAEGMSPAVGVTAVLRLSQERGSFGATDPAEGRLDRVSRVDLPRLQQQLDYPLYPMWAQVIDPAAVQPPADSPIPTDPPDLGDGPHLGYAGQWFLFTIIVLVGFPVLVRRNARSGGGAPRERPAS